MTTFLKSNGTPCPASINIMGEKCNGKYIILIISEISRDESVLLSCCLTKMKSDKDAFCIYWLSCKSKHELKHLAKYGTVCQHMFCHWNVGDRLLQTSNGRDVNYSPFLL